MTTEPCSLPETLSRAAAMWPQNIAVLDNRHATSYAELLTLVSQIGAELEILGIGPGDRVAILLPNSRNFVATHFGALAAGAISVPLSGVAEISDLTRMIQCSQPLVLITDAARYARLVDSEIATFPWLLVALVEETNSSVRLNPLKSWKNGIIVARSKTFSDRGVCDVLMFTNGTSGTPKGVMLRYRNVVSVIKSVESFIGYTDTDVELIALPLSHSFGLGQLYTCLAKGACACISVDLAFPAKVSAEALRLQATGISCTPAMLTLLLKFCPELLAGSPHLRYCVVNSAAVLPQIVNRVCSLNPKLRFFHYYGLTEASRTTFICFNDSPGKAGSVGRPMRHACVKITGDDVSELPHGETGQIAISGDAIFCGYWRDLAGSQAVMRDEWFYTGDLGYIDEDGFLFLVGRLGDVINFDGLKFHPAEVEAVMLQVPGVRGAGVVAVQEAKEISGIKLIGVVSLEAGTVLDGQVLRTACARQLQSYKIPRIFIAVDAIPQSISGKLDRNKLRMLAELSDIH